MNNLSSKGLIAGGFVWVVLITLFVGQVSCLDYGDNCGSGDLFLFLICAIGFLGPSYIVATLFSP